MLHSDLHPPKRSLVKLSMERGRIAAVKLPKTHLRWPETSLQWDQKHCSDVIVEPPNSQLKHPKTRCEKCTAETGWSNWWGVEGVKTLSPSLHRHQPSLPELCWGRDGVASFSQHLLLVTLERHPRVSQASHPPINTRSHHSKRGPNIQPSPDSTGWGPQDN